MGPHNIFFVAGIIGFLICLEGLFCELYFDYDIRILGVQLICEQPLNNRCFYQYLVKQGDGTLNRVKFHGYMFRDNELVVGNTIKKDKLSFEYQVNGSKVSWEFAGHYVTILLFSVLVFALWRRLTPRPMAPKDY